MGAHPGCCLQKDSSSINIQILNSPLVARSKKIIKDASLQNKLEKPQLCTFKEDNEIEEIQHQFDEINDMKIREFSQRKVLFLRSFWRVENQTQYKQKSIKSQSNQSYNSERILINLDRNNVKGILKNTSSSHDRNQSNESDKRSKSNKSVRFDTQSFKKPKKKKYNLRDNLK